MAYTFTQGSGTTAAADVHGTAHNISATEQVPFVAIGTGTLGSLALATVANPFPVTVGIGGSACVGGAGVVTSATPRMTLASDDPVVTSVQIMDDWDESDRAKVNLIVGQAGIAAGAGAVGVTVPRMTLASDDPAVTSLQLIDDAVVADDAAFTPATTKTIAVGFFADETATDSVNEGDLGAARITLDRKQIVVPYAHAAGGATPYKLVSAATTNATSVKAAAGTLYGVTVNNVNAAVRYLKLYDLAAAPTVGTDTPVHTIAIPAGTVVTLNVPACGIVFGTGIAFALTTEATDAGTTAVSANEHVVNLLYT